MQAVAFGSGLLRRPAVVAGLGTAVAVPSVLAFPACAGFGMLVAVPAGASSTDPVAGVDLLIPVGDHRSHTNNASNSGFCDTGCMSRWWLWR